jgi:hypothetical protein
MIGTKINIAEKVKRLKPGQAIGLLLVFLVIFTAGFYLINYYRDQANAYTSAVVDTSASAQATADGFQRKTFFDAATLRYWSFSYNGSAIEYSVSANGTNWTSAGTLAYNTSDFSTAYKLISGTGYVFLSANCGSGCDICVKKGTLSAGSISWSGEYVPLNGVAAADAYQKPVITLDSYNNIWIAARRVAGTSAGEASYQLYAARSANSGDVSSWDPASLVGNKSNRLDSFSLIPGDGGTVSLIQGNDSNNIVGYSYNGSAWSKANAGGDYSWLKMPNEAVNGYVFAIAVMGTDIYAGGSFTSAGGVAVNYIGKWNGTAWSALGSGMSHEVHSVVVFGTDLYAGGSFTTAGGSPANYIAKWNGTAWSSLGTGMNGDVTSLAVSGTDLYAGGHFTAAGGVAVNYVAKWNGSAWSSLGTGMNNYVTALIFSGTDLYAAGEFATAGGTAAVRIAKWNGTAWSALGAGVDNTVLSLAVIGTDLYAGGYFTTAGGVSANRIAKWNGSTWSALGSGVSDTAVNALAVSGTDLYAGGNFVTAGGATVNYVAKWNGSAWSSLGSGVYGNIRSLAVSGTDLYAGGQVVTAGGSPASGIAKWNGVGLSDWSSLGSGMDGHIVDAFAVVGTDLYAAGEFTTAGGVVVNNIAKWDGSSWSSLGGGVNGPVTVLYVDDTNLYVGGNFTTAGGISANCIAKWNGFAWSNLGIGTDDTVYGIAVIGTDLYAGGAFATAGGVTVNRIAKWDGSSWSALGTGTDSTYIYALASIGTDLYAAGNFKTMNGVTVNYIAKWSGTAWSSLGGGVGRNIQTMIASGTDIYVGGVFVTAGGVTANRIAKWNGSTWSALGTGMNSAVQSLVFSGTDLYAGGSFTTAGGSPANYVAKWNGSAWSPISAGTDDDVYALAVIGTDLYAGGLFTAAGGISAGHIAKNGSACSSWSAMGVGLNGPVYALAVNGTDLYVGGSFNTAGNLVVNNIAKWDGSSWSSLGGGVNERVQTIVVSGNNIYAGGYFTTAGGVVVNRIAKWNGTSWSSLGSGMNSYVYSITSNGTDLYAGGSFTTAGGVAVNYVAKWNGSAWSSLGTGTNGTVYSLKVSSNGYSVYAGGSFTTAGGVTVNNIANWDGSDWSALGTGMNSAVYALYISGANLYAGGSFTTAGGSAANYVARWNESNSTWFALGSGTNGSVRSLVFSGPDLCAGGSFTTAGGSPANRIARWDNASWSAMGAGTDGSYIYALASIGTDVYSGGDFSYAGGKNSPYLAIYGPVISAGAAPGQFVSAVADASGNTHLIYRSSESGRSGNIRYKEWKESAVPADWTVSNLGSGLNGGVYALASIGTDVYAGGYFTSAGGTSVKNIAKWDGGSWSAVGTPPWSNGQIYALVSSGTDLYAGGSFTGGVAKWDSATNAWSLLGNITGGSQTVYSLAVSGEDLYVAGSFTAAGGVSANCIAKWNGTSWSSLGTGPITDVRAVAANEDNVYIAGYSGYAYKWDGFSWSAFGGEVDSWPSVLAFNGADLYMGGRFDHIDGVWTGNIVRWNGTKWVGLGNGIGNNGTDVRSIVFNGTDVYAGGSFQWYSSYGSPDPADTFIKYVARWDGGSWSSFGMNAPAYSLLMTGTDLYAGGSFAVAGGNQGNNIIKWNKFAWGDAEDLDVNSNNLYPSASIKPGENSFYAFWTRDNKIYFKKRSYLYASGEWDLSPTLMAQGTNVNYLSSPYSFFDNIFVQWTDGAASPYSVKWASSIPPISFTSFFIDVSDPDSCKTSGFSTVCKSGERLVFNSVASSLQGETVKLYVCKDGACIDCGPSDTSNCWAYSGSGILNDPSASYDSAASPCCSDCGGGPCAKGSYYCPDKEYWGMVCSSDNDCSGIFGYPPSPGWAKNFSENYHVTGVEQLPDGGYYISGQLKKIAKIDPSGNLSWSKELTASGDDSGDFWSLEKTGAGEYITVGQTHLGLGEMDFILSKFSSSGGLVWAKTIGTDGWEWGYGAIPTSDGGYLAVGGTDDGPGGYSWLMAKIDQSGAFSWARILGTADNEDALSVLENRDGKYIVMGSLHGYGTNETTLVIELDQDGDLSWAKEISEMRVGVAHQIQQTSDGGYIISGETSVLGAGNEDQIAVKLDPEGNFSWAKTIGGPGSEESEETGIQQTIDGGYIAVSRSDSFGSDSILLTKINSLGGFSWARSITSLGFHVLAKQTFDGGYIIAGDSGIMKLDPNGNLSGCPSVSSVVPTVSDQIVTISPSSLTLSPTTLTVSDQPASVVSYPLSLISSCPF